MKYTGPTGDNEHDRWMEQFSTFIPSSYDQDETIEVILLNYLRELSDFNRIFARITSDFR